MVTTSHKTVMVRVADGDDKEEGMVCFGNEELNLPEEQLNELMEGPDAPRLEAHFMSDELYQEMGCPTVVTVTVQPGDLLNNTLPEAPRLDG